MTRSIPNQESLRTAMHRAEERRAFWDAHRAELTSSYPDEFVAIFERVVIDHDSDLMVLVQRLRAAGRELHDAWIEFAATDRHKLVL
jgi:hypothetical protein